MSTAYEVLKRNRCKRLCATIKGPSQINVLYDPLKKGSATYGPRGGCGPSSKINRPVDPSQIVVSVWPA